MRVRATAGWGLRNAELAAEAALGNGASGAKRRHQKARAEAENVDPKVNSTAKRLKDTDGWHATCLSPRATKSKSS